MADNLSSGNYTMVWVDGALRSWIANHLDEVTQTMIPANQRYHANRGEWPLRYEVIDYGT